METDKGGKLIDHHWKTESGVVVADLSLEAGQVRLVSMDRDVVWGVGAIERSPIARCPSRAHSVKELLHPCQSATSVRFPGRRDERIANSDWTP